jgi:predicted nuclease of restriction endonuclease-like (RecB) superfamily
LSVKNDEARQFYETTAIEKKWTRDELVKAIQADHFGEDPTKGNGTPPKQLKAPSRRTLYLPGVHSSGC